LQGVALPALIHFGKEPLYVSGRLSDALLVFYQGDAHVSVTMLAKTGAGRDRHFCLVH
jgi:hypothetical protein